MKFRFLPTTIASLFLGTALSNATTIFTDTFDSGTGSWYKASTTGTLSNSSQRLSWAENGSNMAEAIGRSFTSQTLAVGQTIRLTFDFTWSSGISSGNAQIFRIGLFDVTNAITADNWSASNAIGASAGYYTLVRDGSASGNFARKETSATVSADVGPTNGSSTGSVTTPIGSNTTNYNMPNGTAYQGLFEVTYVSATQIDTLFTLNEGLTNRFSVSGSQTSGSLVTSFDTVVMKAGANTATITLDNVQLTVIPEPSAAVLGAFGVLALLRRRRN